MDDKLIIYGRNSVREFLCDTFLRPDDMFQSQASYRAPRQNKTSQLLGTTRGSQQRTEIKSALLSSRVVEDGTAANTTQHFIKKFECADFRTRWKGKKMPESKFKKKNNFSSVLILIMTNHSWSPLDNIKHTLARNYFWRALLLCWGWHVETDWFGTLVFRNREVVCINSLK